MKEIIKVIHCNEMESFFDNLKSGETSLTQKLLCSTCGIAITKENFGGVTRKGGRILLSCSSEECFINFLSQTS